MKKIRIVSKVRFTVFIMILLIGIAGCLTSAVTADAAQKSASPARTASQESQEYHADQEYRTIHVCSGDTLWTIADAYGKKDGDIRAYVQQIRAFNHMESSGELTAGQTLRIPQQN